MSATRRNAAFLTLLIIVPSPAWGVTNLATNPGFENSGNGWGSFGAAGFNAFFGANGHASIFADTAGNSGGFFQGGIPAQPGKTYQFDLLDTRIEANFDARLRVGLEFYEANDATKVGETFLTVNTDERLALPNVDSGGGVNAAVFSHRGVAPAGAAIVRPVVIFDEVNLTYLTQDQANAFAFDAFVSEVPAPGGNLLKNPGFDEDVNLDGNFSDVWRSFGNTGFNNFFGENRHASVFADTAGNSGGFYQQSILAEAGKTYDFALTDVRVETNFDARLRFGLEYYASDDFTLLGSTLATADTSVTGDGRSFSMQATPVAGAVYVRPIVLFDEVNPAYLFQTDANLFVFDTTLSIAAAGIPGDANGDGSVDLLDLDILGANFGSSPATLAQGDFNADNTVDLLDLDILGANFGVGATSLAIPEPSTVALMFASLAGFMRGGRR